MELNEHEIWDRPVAAVPVEPERGIELPVSGRLYASAGVTGHPDAIVALPRHTRNFVSVADLPEAVVRTPAAPAPQAPIIQDPAIAEMLAPAESNEQPPSFDWARNSAVDADMAADTEDPYKDWYAKPAVAAAPTPARATPGLGTQQLGDAANRARRQLQGLGVRVSSGSFGVRKYAVVTVVVTALVGVIDAVFAGSLAMPFGIALLLTTTFGALKLEHEDAWAGWVMPAYVAIAATLVAGQFADGAPGLSIVGQVLLVGTTVITIAPWLAIATAIGMLVPRFRKR